MASPRQDITDEDRVHRHRRANAILNDPLFREAFDRAEEEFIQKWKLADTTQERELMWTKVHALREVERYLRTTFAQGETVAALKKAKERREGAGS